MAAVDCELGKDVEFYKNMPYNVTAFPTILYYQNGKLKFPYNSGHTKEKLFNFLDNPVEEVDQPKWSESKDSLTTHLTGENYDAFMAEHTNVMVYFHAMYAYELCREGIILKYFSNLNRLKMGFYSEDVYIAGKNPRNLAIFAQMLPLPILPKER